MKKKTLALMMAILMIAPLLTPFSVSADEGAFWEGDIWELDTLKELGAAAPDYNKETDTYEISAPEQLFYLSGCWKNGDENGDGAADAPCDGNYILTADLDMAPLMAKIGDALTKKSGKKMEGYMPPIAASTDEERAGGENCAFFGCFDGQNHVIRNLSVKRLGDKYCGLFGNVGYDYGEGFVKNLAILDAKMEAMASVGILAGAVYGEIENITVTGTIVCHEKTAGGLAGKIKKNEVGYIGLARNCFANVDITILGEGSENGAAGGITAANSNGGAIYNCFCTGTITVLDEGADGVGGVTGNLKSGTAIDNTVMAIREIRIGDGTNIGILCGNYSGESGSHLHNNYAWEGTVLEGGVASDHPVTAAFAYAGTDELLSKSFYAEKAGWDFDTVWTWVGEEQNGFPALRGQEETMAAELSADELRAAFDAVPAALKPVEPTVSISYEGEYTEMVFFVSGADEVTDAVLHYGTGKKADDCATEIPMDIENGVLSADFPELKQGTFYYYITVTADGKALTFPTKGTLKFTVASASDKYAPGYLTLCPGADPTKVGFNWTTTTGGLTSELRYRLAGGSEWAVVPCTEIVEYTVGDDKGSFVSYSVDLEGLVPNTAYEYMAVTSDGSKNYNSDICKFTTLPAEGDFSFVVISDLQATSEEGYAPWKQTLAGFMTNVKPNFIVNVGDLTEDDTVAEWSYLYDTIGASIASTLTAYAPGNHESKGDKVYTLFKGRTNQPGGMTDDVIGETTGSFVIGDACFVILNTEPYSGKPGADPAAEMLAYYEAQKAWAKEVFEASGCKWRIIFAHAGLVQDSAELSGFLQDMCDELNVDLYFNGHIHNYYRASVHERKHAELGVGTTFVTTSPMGCKFDPFEDYIPELLDFQTGGADDERQYFTQVTVSADTITVTAYQRTEAGTNYTKLCKDYSVIDTFTLTKTENDNLEPVEPKPASAPWYLYAGIACAVILCAGVTLTLVKKKKK